MTNTSTTEGLEYEFTTTLEDGEVDEYQTVTYGDYGGFKETFGAGSKAIVVVPTGKPIVSVQVGLGGENIGTLKPTDLYTSASSVFSKLCPSVTGSSSRVACDNRTTPLVGGIDYIAPDGTLAQTGTLTITIKTSLYMDNNIREAMIKAAAGTLRDTASGNSSCAEVQYGACGTHGCDSATIPLCATTDFTAVQVYDGQQIGEAYYMDVDYGFEESGDAVFDCELVLELVNIGLDAIAPEFVLADDIAIDTFMAICSGDDGG
jgi:hypothetical protein